MTDILNFYSAMLKVYPNLNIIFIFFNNPHLLQYEFLVFISNIYNSNNYVYTIYTFRIVNNKNFAL